MPNPFQVQLSNLPPEGRSFRVDDPSVWERPVAEFAMDLKFASAPLLEASVLPVDGGWLLRGRIAADVLLPCSRCLKDVPVRLDERFEDFAAAPGEGEDAGDSFAAGDDHLSVEGGVPLLDLAEVAWERFALALPPAPLCSPDCRGLCPRCGADLNAGPCSCPPEEGDPRLAVLRGLKIGKR